MNYLVLTSAALACLTFTSVASAATSNEPVTRAQVRSELVQLEKAGYKPSKANYPDNIQAAERRVEGDRSAAPSEGVGGIAGSTFQSGASVTRNTWNGLYSRH